jgi:hypothetical protein
MCVAAMSLCMIVLIVTRKRGDSRYYFALWQTNNNTPNKLLLSESVVSCILRVRSVSFTSRAKGCIKFVPHSCLVPLSHQVGVFLEEAICYFIYAKFSHVRILIIIGYYTLLYSYNFNLIKNTHLRHVTVHYFPVLYNRKPYFFRIAHPILGFFFVLYIM